MLVPRARLAAARAAVAARAEGLRGVYGSVEPGLALELRDAPGPAPAAVVSRASAGALLSLLAALPHGPVRMSPALEGLVETSNNVASVKPQRGGPPGSACYGVVVSTRSSLPAALAAERERIAAVARLAGARGVEQPPDYAGWCPNPDSPVLALAKQAVAKVRACKGPGLGGCQRGAPHSPHARAARAAAQRRAGREAAGAHAAGTNPAPLALPPPPGLWGPGAQGHRDPRWAGRGRARCDRGLGWRTGGGLCVAVQRGEEGEPSAL